MSRKSWGPILLPALLAAGCPSSEDVSPRAAIRTASPPDSAPVQWVPRSFVARSVEEEWVERIPRSEVGEFFLLHLDIPVRTPAEGPFDLTLGREGAAGVVRLPALRVDPSSGRITLLMRTAELPAGDYRVRLDVTQGGRTLGVGSREYVFRLEPGREAR